MGFDKRILIYWNFYTFLPIISWYPSNELIWFIFLPPSPLPLPSFPSLFTIFSYLLLQGCLTLTILLNFCPQNLEYANCIFCREVRSPPKPVPVYGTKLCLVFRHHFWNSIKLLSAHSIYLVRYLLTAVSLYLFIYIPIVSMV